MPWIWLAVAVWVIGLLAVPQESFRRLVPFGLVAGFGLAFLINLFGTSIFQLWSYGRLSWPILGTPFWVLLAWIPAVVLFVHFLPEESLPRLAWLLLFPAAYTLIEFLFIRAGLRFYSHSWNLAYAFLLSLGTHMLVLSYYLTSIRQPSAPLSTSSPAQEGTTPQDKETLPPR